MALTVTHTFVSAIPDDPAASAAGEVLPQAHWNAAHTVSGTAFTLTTTGSSGASTYTGGTLNIPIYSGGGSGTPGGSNTQVQYNNAGAFGGITGATTNGTALTLVAPVLGTPASGNLSNCTALPVGSITGLGTGVGTALGVNVGTAGAFVVNGGALGTPSSGTLTSCTGLPISTGISGLGTGVATFLATPSSANLAAAVTDETGSGALVFATSPTFVTPILGTPTSGTLTNCTAFTLTTTGTSGAATYSAGTLNIPQYTGGGGGSPGGSDTQVQFNDSGAFGGDADFTWNKTTNLLTLGGSVSMTGPTLRMGAADAAAPVAQTINVQSVVAGTTNTQGATFSIAGSKSTGNAAGGLLKFQIGGWSGSSGTSQGALFDALTVDNMIATVNRTKLIFPDNSGIATGGHFAICDTASSDCRVWITSNMLITINAGFQWSDQGQVYSQSPDTGLNRNTAGVVEINQGTKGTLRDLTLRNTVGQVGYTEMVEMTAPTAGAANTGRIYMEDNGSGKTRLMVIFNSGAAQQIAIQP